MQIFHAQVLMNSHCGTVLDDPLSAEHHIVLVQETNLEGLLQTLNFVIFTKTLLYTERLWHQPKGNNCNSNGHLKCRQHPHSANVVSHFCVVCKMWKWRALDMTNLD